MSSISSSSSTNKSSNDPIQDNSTESSTQSSGEEEDDEEKVFTPYERWVRRLYMTNMFHPVKLGLANMEQLHAALGNPMNQIPVVHVAGTNGKGSVVYKTAQALIAINNRTAHSNSSSIKTNGQGGRGKLNVGIFVSPHIASFRERMQVNNEPISEVEVVQLLPRIYDICIQQDIPATFFEITTALAFSFFASRHADVVVLETGLGGRLDATNVIHAPTLSIITSIGLEHTRILGDTVELIAMEKGGIIKPNCPVLVGPHVPHEVLRQCALERKASHYYTCDDVLASSLEMREFVDYDLENARIARAALTLLQKTHPQQPFGMLTEEDLAKGLAQRPPCRFELIQVPALSDGNDEAAMSKNNVDSMLSVILDVAHNPDAMKYLVRKLQATYEPENTEYRFVVGMSSDKDLKQCITSLLSTKIEPRQIHFVEAANPRAAKLEDIVKAARELLPSNKNDNDFGFHYDLEDRSVSKQVLAALNIARSEITDKKANEKKKKQLLVICGSVFLMADAREALGIVEPRDSEYIAQVAGAGTRAGQENFGNTGTTTLPSATKTSIRSS
jgi:dihydrofolate synthase / folylpolyglutamate synthase